MPNRDDIGCCSGCRKRDGWKDRNGRELLLGKFDDALEDVRFFAADERVGFAHFAKHGHTGSHAAQVLNGRQVVEILMRNWAAIVHTVVANDGGWQWLVEHEQFRRLFGSKWVVVGTRRCDPDNRWNCCPATCRADTRPTERTVRTVFRGPRISRTSTSEIRYTRDQDAVDQGLLRGGIASMIGVHWKIDPSVEPTVDLTQDRLRVWVGISVDGDVFDPAISATVEQACQILHDWERFAGSHTVRFEARHEKRSRARLTAKFVPAARR